MEASVWVRKIFENEFEIEADPEQEAREWLDDFVVGDTFEEFYDQQVRNVAETKYSAGSNRAYSIREPPFNCEGQATVGLIAGELEYDRDLELLLDWDTGRRGRGNPHRNHIDETQTFNSHVALQDESGEIFGRTALMNNPQTAPPEKATGIYLVNLADEARFNDEREDPEDYLDQIDVELSSQYAGARRKKVQNRI